MNILKKILDSLKELKNTCVYYFNRARPENETEEEEEEDDEKGHDEKGEDEKEDDGDKTPASIAPVAAPVGPLWLPGNEEHIVDEMGQWFVQCSSFSTTSQNAKHVYLCRPKEPC